MISLVAFHEELAKLAAEEPKNDLLKDIEKKFPHIAKPQAKGNVKQAFDEEAYLSLLLEKFAAGIASGFKTMMTAAPKAVSTVLPKPAVQGFGGMKQLGQAVVKPAANPTRASAGRAARDFALLPKTHQELLRNSQPVKEWGVTPVAAMQVADWSRKGNETLMDSISRNVLHGGATYKPQAVANSAAANMATVAPGARKIANAIAGNYGPGSNMQNLPGVINNKSPALNGSPTAPSAPKLASVAGAVGKSLASKPGVLRSMGEHLANHGNAYDLAGLGLLAAPSAVTMGKQIKNKAQGKSVDKHQVMHDAAELGGLGLIAAPVAASMLLGRGGH